MKTVKGFGDHLIYIFENELESAPLIEQSTWDFYQAYNANWRTIHYWDSKKNKECGTDSHIWAKKNKEYTKKIFKGQLQDKGYPVEGRQYERVNFIFGVIVHQLPFLDEWNTNIEKYMFDEDKELLSWEECKERIRNDIGLDVCDWKEEVDEEHWSLVDSFLEKNDVEIHEVQYGSYGELILTCGSQKWIIETEEGQGEDMATDYLEQGEHLWRDAVGNGSTMLGFKDWCRMVLDVDGWDHIVCSYDGYGRYLKNNLYYWRSW